MLSTETPSDPPSSHQTPISSPKHAQHCLSTFSIRDYVFSSRKEHIEEHWPFSQQHLQLFSKHEIKDILPPFETPDSLRKQCRKKSRCQLSSEFYSKKPDHSLKEKKYSGQAPPLLREHERLKLQSRLSRLVIDDGESETESDPSNGQLPCSPQEDSFFEARLDRHHPQLQSPPQKKETTAEPSGRKCRLIVKLGLMSDQTHSDNTASNVTTISDSMASKVCPVCKTFSSTSNTTLNAHIDQCLAAEPTPKSVRDDIKLNKHRIKQTHMTKPAKKRSMVDIYATAKSCTLEDLDKRNGSNWASNSSLLIAEPEAMAYEKRPRLSDAPLEDTNDENPVYFDSSGTKIRIISKISNAPMRTDGDGPKKLLKDGKESKTISFEVKKNIQLKNVEHRKGKQRSKKLCSIVSNDVALSGEHEMNSEMDKVCNNEESSQVLKAGDGINCNELGTLKQWICSKRTNILRRARTKINHRGLRLSSLITTNPLHEKNNVNNGDSSCRYSDSCGNVVSPLTTTHTDTSRYESEITGCTMDSHARPERRLSPFSKESISDRNGGCLLKLPKSQGKFASSPGRKRLDVSVDPSGNVVCFPKAKKSSSSSELVSKPSFSSLRSKLNRKRSILRKPRVRISMSDMDELVESQPLNIEQPYECMNNSAENLCMGCHTGVSKKGSSDKVMPEVEVSIDKLSLDGMGVLSSIRGGESTRNLERGDPMTTEEASSAGTFNQYLDMDGTIESHVKTHLLKFNSSNNTAYGYDDLGTSAEDYPVNVDAVGETFLRKADETISKSIKTIDSEFHIIPSQVDAQSNASQSSGEQHGKCLCKTKMLMPSMQQKVSDSDVCSIGVDTYTISEANPRFVATSFPKCLFTKSGSDSLYVPAPPVSLSPTIQYGNSVDHLEKSSLTSCKMPFTKYEYMVPDRGSSESPVSMTSPISHPIKARSCLMKSSNPESCTKPSEVQDKLVQGFWGGLMKPTVKDAASLQFSNGIMGAERFDLLGEGLKATTVSPPEESLIYTGERRCCCLRNKSLASDGLQNYQDVHLHCTGESSMKAAVEKQVECYMNVGPAIHAKPDSFVFSRNSQTMASSCGSPGGSVSTHFTNQDVQSTPNSVLRLMGKNLMVTKKDEDGSVKLRQPAPISSNSCTSMMCLNLLRCSPGTLSNQDSVTSHFEVPEGSVVSSQDSCTPRSHFFNDNHSKTFTSHSCSTIDQRQLMVGNGNNVYVGEVDSSLVCHGMKSKTNLPIDQKKSINWLDSFPYKVEDVVAPRQLQPLHHMSAVQKIGIPATEVIVIDDTPEIEAELNGIKAKYVHGQKESHPSPVAVLPPVSTYRSMSQNAFCYHASNGFSQVEPLVGTKRSFPLLHHGDATKSPSKWGARDPFASRIYQFPNPSLS